MPPKEPKNPVHGTDSSKKKQDSSVLFYDRLSFWEYADRLKLELNDVLFDRIEQHLTKMTPVSGQYSRSSSDSRGRSNPTSLLGIWVALGSQIDSDNLDKLGFTIAAWSFNAYPAYDKEFSAIVEANAANLASLGTVPPSPAPADISNHKLNRDYIYRLASDNSPRPGEELLTVSRNTVLSCSPRDYVVHQDAIAIVTRQVFRSGAKKPKSGGKAKAYLFHRTKDAKNGGTIQTIRGYSLKKTLDQPAAAAFSYVLQKINPGHRSVALALVPLKRPGGSDGGSVHAVLGLVFKTQRGMDKELISGDVDRLTDRAKSLHESVVACQREVGGNPIVCSAIEMMKEAYRRRKEHIFRLITKSDQNAMDDRQAAAKKDFPTLQSLKKHLTTLSTDSSPVRLATDAACDEVLAAMRALMQTIDREDLIDPVLQFAAQERQLLGEEKRRDHYLHTLKVFLIGRALLQKLNCYDDFIRPRWILASIFHDVCYPLQKAEEWAGKTIGAFFPEPKTFQYDLNALPLIDSWQGRAYERCERDMFFRIVDYRLNAWLRSDSSKSKAWTGSPSGRRFQAVVTHQLVERNHAVLSALSLLMHAKRNAKGREMDVVYGRARQLVNDRRADECKEQSEVIDAATAILMHDTKIWAKLLPAEFAYSDVSRDGRKRKGEREDCVKVLVWALACADFLQEWGRDPWMDPSGDEVRDDFMLVEPEWHEGKEGETPSPLVVTVRYGAQLASALKKLLIETREIVNGGLKSVGDMKDILVVGDENDLRTAQRGNDGVIGRFNWRRAPGKGTPNDAARGSGWGLDYVPGREHRRNGASVEALHMSVLSAMYDLIGGECLVGSEDWWHAVVGLGVKGRPEHGIDLPDIAANARDAANREQYERVISQLKRLHGFQRVPRAAVRFWGVSSAGPILIRTIGDDGDEEMLIDQLPLTC